jgi:mannose-6-phosphate isomerase
MNRDDSGIAEKPVFFERNRVSRVYTGGKLFHDFFGDAEEDGFRPEEWIASGVRAINGGGGDTREGLSVVEGTDILFCDLIAAERERMIGRRDSLGVLVKVLDSAVRLPVQAHPDKPFSRKHFHSDFGKAEAWVVLATRENAKIHFGFKERMTKARFDEAIERSETDRSAMERLLNAVPAKPGDVYFIPPKAVHAIGFGCLILEIQEPTDFTIQPEAWCGDYRLSPEEKTLGLDRDAVLECFDYSLFGEEAVRLGQKRARPLRAENGLVSEDLIGPEDTDCFALRRHRFQNRALNALKAPAVYIVTRGEGRLFGPDGVDRALKKGDYFFLPACASGRYGVLGETPVELLECLPPSKP